MVETLTAPLLTYKICVPLTLFLVILFNVQINISLLPNLEKSWLNVNDYWVYFLAAFPLPHVACNTWLPFS